jgi:hypothetical protein
MRIKKRNVARLASLSALGAGALGVAAGTAQADIVGSTFTPPVTVGPDGINSVTGMGMPGYTFRAFWISTLHTVSLYGPNVRFREWYWENLRVFSARKTWNSASGSHSHAGAQITNGRSPFNDQYALFQFGCPSGSCYGWLELSVSASEGGFAPDVTLVGWAYDASGNPIPAGETPSVPEPSTIAVIALNALALGAVGLRRWRSARKLAA